MDDSAFPIIIGTFFGGLVLYAIMNSLVRSPGASLRHKFQELGTIQGRTLHQIIAVVGPPNSRSVIGNGRVVCQWMATGYHVALIFTDDICDGISHEYAA
jgi:hypothetical protein